MSVVELTFCSAEKDVNFLIPALFSSCMDFPARFLLSSDGFGLVSLGVFNTVTSLFIKHRLNQSGTSTLRPF